MEKRMSKNINKFYEKALNYQRQGKINAALDCCEKGISRSLKNKNLLNLKGLLLYTKGELNEAIAIWKVNSDFNNDEIARIYIRDAREDRRKLDLFNEAKSDSDNYRIDDAIEKLKICDESDFNSINVNYLLAICYLRKGNYKVSKDYIDKALSIDCENKLVLALDKENREFYTDNNKKNKKLLVVCMLGCILIGSIAIYFYNSKSNNQYENNLSESQDITIENSNNIENENNNIQNDNQIIEVEDQKQENISQEIKSYTHKELERLYILASDLFSKEDYEGAINTLKDVYDNSSNSYLNDHILYLFANSYQYNNDKENSNKYYEMYVDKYYGESYIEETLYNLSMNYNGVDNEKAKKYANKKKSDYKESIYFNDNIKKILNS